MKKIGIPAWKTGENSVGVTIPYVEYINRFGTPVILMPEDTEVHEELDLLILPGGSDIDPMRYGAIPRYDNSRPDPLKEYFDRVMLSKYIKAKVPIFGICRGMQSICVWYGASLVQDMWHETSNDRGEVVHELTLETDPVPDMDAMFKFGKAKIKVNSLHHQCVSNVGFPKDLAVVAVYKGKRRPCIEAIRHKSLPICGVQYHPEELFNDPLGDLIVNNLLRYKELQREIEFAKINYD